MLLVDQLKSRIRDVKDFPKPGILFKDITPVFADPALMKDVVSFFRDSFAGKRVDAVVGIEARGFIFGSLLALAMECPFVPVRKSGKLPFKTFRREYSLEYGQSAVEMHVDAIKPGSHVLIHDDVLATGGTAIATGELVRSNGGQLAGFCFLLNLGFLEGARQLVKHFGIAPVSVVDY